MPLYDYRCTVCQREFDKLMKMSDVDKDIPCEECGGVAKRTVAKVQHFDRLGSNANLSSVRFHFNYTE